MYGNGKPYGKKEFDKPHKTLAIQLIMIPTTMLLIRPVLFISFAASLWFSLWLSGKVY